MPCARSILAAARDLALDVEALLLPRACLGCERPLPPRSAHMVCCDVCLHRMRRIAPPVCARCGQPLDRWSVQWEARAGAGTGGRRPADGRERSGSGHCEYCAEWPDALAWAASAVWLEDGPARNLVHALKYGGWTAAAEPMAAIAAGALRARLASLDALVPVPLGAVRLRERGHNQAELLARAVGRAAGLPVLAGPLRRIRETRTQTRLAPSARRRNVEGAFACSGKALGGMYVALVDDVVTTGATLGAAAVALAELGPASVGAISFGRAPIPA